jgi:hypothetical protein
MVNNQGIIISLLIAVVFFVILYIIYYSTKNKSGSSNNSNNYNNNNYYNVDSQKATSSKCVVNNNEIKPETESKTETPPPSSSNEDEVFNVSNNIFTYDDAGAVCNAYGSRLATYDEVKKAYDKGANWCNYGWSDGKLALYPTQYNAWKKLQSGTKVKRKSCGLPGVNGGYFDNGNLKFGANCYGKKPAKNSNGTNCLASYDEDEIDYNNKVNKFVNEIEDYNILPFNKNKWDD